MSEEQLIRRAQQGDNGAFEELLLLHQKKVYNLCLRMSANPDDALDLSQEAFLRAWRSLGQYQFDAVVSFCFNVGIGKFKKSTLYKKIRADAYDSSIPAEFKKWIYGGGKILPGLVTRREWEAKRYQGLTI